MRALRIHRYGGPEVMRIEEVEPPRAGPGELLVRVRAASVNPIDWKMRSGLLAARFPFAFPRTLGRDCAGEAGGRRVAGVADPRTDGTHAEYALLPAAQAANVPPDLDLAAAASLCVAGLSAYICLVEVAKIERGMRVLVHAGAGGVGSLAIQIARHLGAEVFATAGAANREYCIALGARRVIDYRSEDFGAAGPFDVVLDTLGGETHARSLRALKPGGVLVALSAAPIPREARRDNVHVAMPQVQATPERLERIFALAVNGLLRPQVSGTFTLEDAPRAYALSEAGHVRGKLVLLP